MLVDDRLLQRLSWEGLKQKITTYDHTNVERLILQSNIASISYVFRNNNKQFHFDRMIWVRYLQSESDIVVRSKSDSVERGPGSSSQIHSGDCGWGEIV